MGIDLLLYTHTSQILSDQEILVLSREIAEAVGPVRFSLSPDGKWGGHHALYRRVWEEDSYIDRLPQLGTILVANVLHRHYGIGYERGPFPIIAAICEWLQRRVGDVYVGGDCGVGVRLWTDQREELWAHWTEHGGRPYFREWDRDSDEYERVCVFCRTPMNRNGWGPKFALYRCISCGREDKTNDSGATWDVTRNGNVVDPLLEKQAEA